MTRALQISRKIKWCCGLTALSIMASSCLSPEQAAPSVERINAAGRHANTGQLQRGRALYLGPCARCHAAEPVHRYAAEMWQREILPAMMPLVKLAPDDAAALQAYIQAAGALMPHPSSKTAIPSAALGGKDGPQQKSID